MNVRRIAVVVPAHNESTLLPDCLTALDAAKTRVTPTPVRIIVVADACTDNTAQLAAEAGAEIVTISARAVGAARAAGAHRALDAGAAGLWLATTDADSRVPAHWLTWHLRHANAGTELLAGTVAVQDWSAWPHRLPMRYEHRYRLAISRTGHRHVHGANLGVNAAAYLAAGGFPPDTRHDEDRVLVERVRAAGGRVVADASCPVVTSARPAGRAPHGFAAHLASLDTDE